MWLGDNTKNKTVGGEKLNNSIKEKLKYWFRNNIGLDEEIVINEDEMKLITYLNNFIVTNKELKIFTDKRIFKYVIKEIQLVRNYIRIITKDNKKVKIEMF